MVVSSCSRGTFDVRVDDTDKTNLMELIEYMFEDSVKQNVSS